jgi:AcrR family transcriptional regulator
MTDKKEKILEAALELFATEGYASTPTSKIAKKAGVSEGLIFRHFENKQGLLDALMNEAEVKLGEMFGPILFENDSKMVIRKSIELPFSGVDERDFNFWRLQFMLKWQRGYNKPEKMKPLINKLSEAFAELHYEKPEKEAMLLNFIIEAISTEILKGNLDPSTELKSFLLNKYGV